VLPVVLFVLPAAPALRPRGARNFDFSLILTLFDDFRSSFVNYVVFFICFLTFDSFNSASLRVQVFNDFLFQCFV